MMDLTLNEFKQSNPKDFPDEQRSCLNGKQLDQLERRTGSKGSLKECVEGLSKVAYVGCLLESLEEIRVRQTTK
eukprot:gnl/Chilomastix_caulleri/2527.p1 GENE.gnl/Chilomastix_caulleri/2527~~gnl/Chilomastix_caulleri/2527.p1  ORF type:complete len:74 (-),score=21.05 gnl/Chilomastix_caulleri/2527:127-348(-)